LGYWLGFAKKRNSNFSKKIGNEVILEGFESPREKEKIK
jgi:hypothetical protein